MKYITTLPPGNWRLIVFNGDVIAVAPEHAPRIIPKEGGPVMELNSRQMHVICEEGFGL